jgi:hypothetical protein
MIFEDAAMARAASQDPMPPIEVLVEFLHALQQTVTAYDQIVPVLRGSTLMRHWFGEAAVRANAGASFKRWRRFFVPSDAIRRRSRPHPSEATGRKAAQCSLANRAVSSGDCLPARVSSYHAKAANWAAIFRASMISSPYGSGSTGRATSPGPEGLGLARGFCAPDAAPSA